jgi:hypothetical protein
MASLEDKARKARNKAFDQNFAYPYASGSTERIVMDSTRGKAKGAEKVMGRYANAAERRAAAVVQQRRRLDTGKTAARANAIEKRTEKKIAQATTRAGVSGAPKKKAVSAGVTAAAKKAAAKSKTIGTGPNKAKVTPMSPAKKSTKGMPTIGRQNMKNGKK